MASFFCPPYDHIAAAFGTGDVYFFHQLFGEFAVWKIAAGKEFAVSAEPYNKLSSVFGAFFINGFDFHFHFLLIFFHFSQFCRKRRPEIGDHFYPLRFSVCNIVKFFLHFGGKENVNNIGKIVNQKFINHYAKFRGFEIPSVDFFNVLALLNSAYYRRVS